MSTDTFDLDARWALHPQVALREESFGALLYHFGTRRLSFLKDVAVVEVVRTLPEHESARSALAAVGVDPVERYSKALAVLADSQMLVRT